MECVSESECVCECMHVRVREFVEVRVNERVCIRVYMRVKGTVCVCVYHVSACDKDLSYRGIR